METVYSDTLKYNELALMKKSKVDRILQAGVLILTVGLVGILYETMHDKLVNVGDSAPDFSITADNGRPVSLTNFGGKILILNFWATWCPPCVTELPLLDRFHNEQRALRWQVVGLAVDQLAPVKDFLRQRPVGFPVGMAGMEGVELSRRLGNSAGALPFSIAFDSEGVPVQRKLGVLTEPDLLGWVASVR